MGSVIVDGIAHPVGARTEVIIRWLLDWTARIDEAAKLKLTFNCRGHAVIPVAEEYWDAETIKHN